MSTDFRPQNTQATAGSFDTAYTECLETTYWIIKWLGMQKQTKLAFNACSYLALSPIYLDECMCFDYNSNSQLDTKERYVYEIRYITLVYVMSKFKNNQFIYLKMAARTTNC